LVRVNDWIAGIALFEGHISAVVFFIPADGVENKPAVGLTPVMQRLGVVVVDPFDIGGYGFCFNDAS